MDVSEVCFVDVSELVPQTGTDSYISTSTRLCQGLTFQRTGPGEPPLTLDEHRFDVRGPVSYSIVVYGTLMICRGSLHWLNTCPAYDVAQTSAETAPRRRTPRGVRPPGGMEMINPSHAERLALMEMEMQRLKAAQSLPSLGGSFSDRF